MTRLGLRLKEERVSRGLTIDEVAKATKIRPQFINAIEQGSYKKLPSKAYAHGFVRNYIVFLDLPMRESLAMFRREFDEREYVDVLPESFTKKREIALNHINWQKTTLATGIVILGFLCFLFFQYREVLFNPRLTILFPKENAILTKEEITVIGSTNVNAIIRVNNVSAYVDQNGHFTKSIVVFPGEYTITVIATNKFGRSTMVKRDIQVKPIP